MSLLFRHLRTMTWILAFAAVLLILHLPTTVNAKKCNNVNQPQPCPTAKNPDRCISAKSICILEPLPGNTIDEITVEQTENLGAFFTYLNGGVWRWAFGVGIGAAVFNGAFAGLQIVLSNGDSGKIEAGKNRFLWSIVGLLILLLAGVILQFINPIGFKNV